MNVSCYSLITIERSEIVTIERSEIVSYMVSRPHGGVDSKCDLTQNLNVTIHFGSKQVETSKKKISTRPDPARPGPARPDPA